MNLNRYRLTVLLLLVVATGVCGPVRPGVAQGVVEEDVKEAVQDTTAIASEKIINPELARTKVDEARQAASRDQHHEAVANYLEALASDAISYNIQPTLRTPYISFNTSSLFLIIGSVLCRYTTSTLLLLRPVSHPEQIVSILSSPYFSAFF